MGCGGDDEADPQAEEAPDEQSSEGQTAQQAEQEAEQADDDEQAVGQPAPALAQRGGIIRLFAPTDRHDRWDPHRSRFRFTQSFHALIYNRLLRPSSVSNGVLEGDLCSLPETPDEQSYLFEVIDGARFWDRAPTDGRAFTGEDIRFNIERQQQGLDFDGNPDPLFYRQADYRRTASLEVTGERTIRLETDGPDAAYLGSVHAGPFAWMTSPEAAERFGASWRSAINDQALNSGTGPYWPQAFAPGGELVLRRSENWWGAGGFADGFVFVGGGPGNIFGLYSSAAIDRADFPLPNDTVKNLRDANPDDSTFELALDAPVQLLTTLSDDPESPFGDPRLLRALGIAIDRFALIERLYDGDGRPSGPLPWFLSGWALPEQQLLATSGYRPDKEDDLAEVRDLIAAAGGVETLGEIDLVVADLFEGFFPGVGSAVAAELSERTGLTVNARPLAYLDALAGVESGEVNLLLAWGEPPQTADPTDTWRRRLRSDGAENWGNLADLELDALIDEMQKTLDFSARQGLARRVQERLLDGTTWIQNVANGIQLGIAKPYLSLDPRALEFAWSNHHLATSWIDSEAEDYPADRALPALPEEPEPEEAQAEQSDGE